MKRTILWLSVLLAMAGTAPASAAFLGTNPRLGESLLNTGIKQVAGDVSREGLSGSGGAWLQGASEFFVAPNASGRTFPANPDELLPEIPRNLKGQIQPSDTIRIRPEQHPLQPGETFAPRHHGQHYHVEIRIDPSKSFNNPKNVIKVKPPGYKPGDGTSFLPGEPLPGM
ncbi:MAG: hypothetical protein JW829_07305 [Pirellulales bacterium]|nr:hypothetical protein [Pirellulales bacterium]